MKIEFKTPKKCVKFSELKGGEAFLWQGEANMKLASQGTNGENAVDLSDGGVLYFTSSDCVERANCKIVVDTEAAGSDDDCDKRRAALRAYAQVCIQLYSKRAMQATLV